VHRSIQSVQVYVSSVIDAPIDKVWALVRDFNSLTRWHPAISGSQIEGGQQSTAVGCVRKLVLTSGKVVREQLLELSDANYRFIYNILESDIGLLDYVAEFSLQRVTDGDRTFAVWSADFRTEPGLEAEKAIMVRQDVFQRGFDALKAKSILL